MSKLKNLISQLTDQDYKLIYNSLNGHEAIKSARLLKYLREEDITDKKIMSELSVNSNAYYTLRSRLNQKIEEFLLQQMKTPRTDLIKKVANVNEIVFSKKKALSIATLKKLEKELLEYDLSNELTIVYKALKKLHIDSSDYYIYSKKYNQHVAYMLAQDKVEELVSDYFNRAGQYMIRGEGKKIFSLTATRDEIKNTMQLYDSHRLKVSYYLVDIFHRLYIEENPESEEEESIPIEDIMEELQEIFDTYYMDTNYHYLTLVLHYLRFLYYEKHNIYKKADECLSKIQEEADIFIENFSSYTFTGLIFPMLLVRAKRNKSEHKLLSQTKNINEDLELHPSEDILIILHRLYASLCNFYQNKFKSAINHIELLLKDVNIKKYPLMHIEVKTLLCLYIRYGGSATELAPLLGSTQRLIRIYGKEKCPYANLFLKIVKTTESDITDSLKEKKIDGFIEKISDETPEMGLFSPLQYIKPKSLEFSNMAKPAY